MRLLIPALVCALVALAAPRAAAATPSADFIKARDVFQNRNFAAAIPLLKDLLYPTARLAAEDELAEAHLLLAVSHFETDNRPEAEAEFRKALRYDDDLSLDPLFFSEEAVDFFNTEKAAYKKKLDDNAEKRRLAAELAAYRRAIENSYIVEKHQYFINFIPFGAGQFQNGDTGKGTFFFLSEGVTLFGSAGLFTYQCIKYGCSGKVPLEDFNFVRRLQQVQIATGALSIGLMAWGVIDSLIHYTPEIRRRADESLLPNPHKPGAPSAPASKGLKPSSFKLLPTANPSGGGLVMSWEF